MDVESVVKAIKAMKKRSIIKVYLSFMADQSIRELIITPIIIFLLMGFQLKGDDIQLGSDCVLDKLPDGK